MQGLIGEEEQEPHPRRTPVPKAVPQPILDQMYCRHGQGDQRGARQAVNMEDEEERDGDCHPVGQVRPDQGLTPRPDRPIGLEKKIRAEMRQEEQEVRRTGQGAVHLLAG